MVAFPILPVRAATSPSRRYHVLAGAGVRTMGGILLLAAIAGCGGAAPKEPALRKEAAEIAERLGSLEERVVHEDPELRRWNESLGAELLSAMNEVDSGVASLADSADVLRTRRAKARRLGDVLAVRRADAALTRLERRFQAARHEALRSGEITTRIQAFDSVVQARMTAREPATPRLLARYRALARQLTGAR
ncbi:MAG TPA: hypothetical protein VFS20_10805 [Longimicrobium sp.]|nr:hypothetical protein [Longimicrobium sp.]